MTDHKPDLELLKQADALVDQKGHYFEPGSRWRDEWEAWKRQYMSGKLSDDAIREFIAYLEPLSLADLSDLDQACIHMGAMFWRPKERDPLYLHKKRG